MCLNQNLLYLFQPEATIAEDRSLIHTPIANLHYYTSDIRPMDTNSYPEKIVKFLSDYQNYKQAPASIAKLMQVHPVYIINCLNKLKEV